MPELMSRKMPTPVFRHPSNCSAASIRTETRVPLYCAAICCTRRAFAPVTAKAAARSPEYEGKVYDGFESLRRSRSTGSHIWDAQHGGACDCEQIGAHGTASIAGFSDQIPESQELRQDDSSYGNRRTCRR